MTDVVLDASALIALLRREPGADRVGAVLDRAWISTVNLAEVVAKGVERGTSLADVTAALAELPIRVEPFTADDAYRSGSLRAATRSAGLSLGDRCCLALGLRTGFPVLTAEQTWGTLGLAVRIETIR